MAVHAESSIQLNTIPGYTSLLGGHFYYKSTATTLTPPSANVIQNVSNNPSEWQYNTHIGANGIKLRYNEVDLSEWSATNGLKLYYPVLTNGVITNSQLGAQFTASALNFYKPGGQTASAVLDSNGLNIAEGSITLGNNFQVTSAGILTATGADISGSITATSFEAWANNQKRAEVTANGLLIYDSSNNLISQFGSFITIGQESTNTYSIKIVSDASNGPGIYFRKNNDAYTSLTSSAIRLGLPSDRHALIDNSGFHIYAGQENDPNNYRAEFLDNGLYIYSGGISVAQFGLENNEPYSRLGRINSQDSNTYSYLISKSTGIELYSTINSSTPIMKITQGDTTSGSGTRSYTVNMNPGILGTLPVFYKGNNYSYIRSIDATNVHPNRLRLTIQRPDSTYKCTYSINLRNAGSGIYVPVTTHEYIDCSFNTETGKLTFTVKDAIFSVEEFEDYTSIATGLWGIRFFEEEDIFNSSTIYFGINNTEITKTFVSPIKDNTDFDITAGSNASSTIYTSIGSNTPTSTFSITQTDDDNTNIINFTATYNDSTRKLTITKTSGTLLKSVEFYLRNLQVQQVRVLSGTLEEDSIYSNATYDFGIRTNEEAGNYSLIAGYQLSAPFDYQTVIGKYNTAIDAPFIIGNGTDEQNLSNACYIDWTGNMHLSGDMVANSLLATNLYCNNIYPKGAELNPLIDYVIETGTYKSPWASGNTDTSNTDTGVSTWNYRKWYSGFAEAWTTMTINKMYPINVSAQGEYTLADKNGTRAVVYKLPALPPGLFKSDSVPRFFINADSTADARSIRAILFSSDTTNTDNNPVWNLDNLRWTIKSPQSIAAYTVKVSYRVNVHIQGYWKSFEL